MSERPEVPSYEPSALERFNAARLEAYVVARLRLPPREGLPLDTRNREQPHDVLVRASRQAVDPAFPSRLAKVIRDVLARTTPVSAESGTLCYFLLCLIEELRIPSVVDELVPFLVRSELRGFPTAQMDVHRRALAAAIALNLEREPRVASLLREELRSREYGLLAASGLAHVDAATAIDAAVGILALWADAASNEEQRPIVMLLLLLERRWRAERFMARLDHRATGMTRAARALFESICAGSTALARARAAALKPVAASPMMTRPACDAGAALASEFPSLPEIVAIPAPPAIPAASEFPPAADALPTVPVYSAEEIFIEGKRVRSMAEPDRRRAAGLLAAAFSQRVPASLQREWAEGGLRQVEQGAAWTRIPLLEQNMFVLTADPEFWLIFDDSAFVPERGTKCVIDHVRLWMHRMKVERERKRLPETRGDGPLPPDSEPGTRSRPSSNVPGRTRAVEALYKLADG